MADRAGFAQQQWDLFLAPIPSAFLYKAPVGGAVYVKHQYCVEVLNRAFGEDGWSMECEVVSDKDQYTDLYHAKGSDGQPAYDENGDPVFKKKLGRKYAVVKCRLTICAPGHKYPAVREDFGSQVAAADWSEAIKGASSEALKRAAARFGFASEVYKTEEIETQFGDDWEPHILPTYTARWEMPIAHLTALKEWMADLELPEERQAADIALCVDANTTGNLGRILKWLLSTARPEAQELMASMDVPESERASIIAKMVDLKTAQTELERLRSEAADMVGGGPTTGDKQRRLMDGDAT